MLKDLKIGHRHRKDTGDLTALADSLSQGGLLPAHRRDRGVATGLRGTPPPGEQGSSPARSAGIACAYFTAANVSLARLTSKPTTS